MSKAILVAAALALGVAGQASAAVIVFPSNTISVQSTNFSSTLILPQFNTALGTLTSVLITLNGQLSGNVRAESMDAMASNIMTNLSAVLTLSRPAGGGVIVVTTPLATNNYAASSFDGAIDFAGTSGVTYSGLMAMANNSATLSSAADLALFTGLGDVATGLSAVGASTATGSGNLITMFQTLAGASATVSYTYDALDTGIPEPASWALMIAGFGGAGAMLRRRRLARA